MGALRHQRQMPRVRIIRMRKVPFVDSTGIHNLTNLCLMSQAEGIQVVLSGVNPTVQAVLHKSGFDAMLGPDNICSHINIALDRAKQLL
jgi:SulP family sulfate permease